MTSGPSWTPVSNNCSIIDARCLIWSRCSSELYELDSRLMYLSNDFGDGGGDLFVEHVGNDALSGRIRHQRRDCLRGGDFHFVGYFLDPVVERATKDARK